MQGPAAGRVLSVLSLPHLFPQTPLGVWPALVTPVMFLLSSTDSLRSWGLFPGVSTRCHITVQDSSE